MEDIQQKPVKVEYENLYIEWTEAKQQKVAEMVMGYVKKQQIKKKFNVLKEARIDHELLMNIILALTIIER